METIKMESLAGATAEDILGAAAACCSGEESAITVATHLISAIGEACHELGISPIEEDEDLWSRARTHLLGGREEIEVWTTASAMCVRGRDGEGREALARWQWTTLQDATIADAVASALQWLAGLITPVEEIPGTATHIVTRY